MLNFNNGIPDNNYIELIPSSNNSIQDNCVEAISKEEREIYDIARRL